MDHNIDDALYQELILENRTRMPEKMRPFLTEKRRYKFSYGGRGGSKSVSIAKSLLYLADQRKLKVLCTREIQNSIRESVHSLLSELIHDLEYSNYEITNTNVYNTATESEFLFAGLWGQDKKQTIKGFSGVDIAWVEEAQAVSAGSLDILIPTIRKDNSELWFAYNPLLPDDPVELLRQRVPDEQKIEVNINYDDNPYLSKAILCDIDISKKAYEAGISDDFLHIWKGMTISVSERTVFRKREIDEAVNRQIPEDGMIEIGADIARYGTDRTIFYKRKGLKVIDRKEYHNQSLVETSRLLIDFTGNNRNVRIKIDDTGLGGGVTDILRDKGYFVVPVNNGSSAQDSDRYNNAISEMWFYLKSIITQVSIPNDQELKSELLTREWNIDSKGRRGVEPKEVYKKRGYRSPDKADGLLLCFYEVGGSNDISFYNQY